MNKKRLKIIIIGGGAAALMAADVLSQNAEVHIYEKGKTIGRKFLVAGKGGFNLTNAASGDELYDKYSPRDFLYPALSAFDSNATRQWLEALGIPTFVGTSGRVFPEKGIKPIQVLQKIKDKLISQSVQFYFGYEFISFSEDKIPIVQKGGVKEKLTADKYIFALGGASWSVTGSTGDWRAAFEQIDVKTRPFQSSNCGVNVEWPENFKTIYAGIPLKNIQLSCHDFTLKGEALITEYGLEGNVVYPAVPTIRQSFVQHTKTFIHIDLKPNSTNAQLLAKINQKSIRTKNYKYTFNLTKAEFALAKQFAEKETFNTPELFALHLKNIPVPIVSLRPLEEAISTVGGIDLNEVDTNFSLKSAPHIFLIGEMLDWDAPTGGFLLQACFSMGAFVG